MKKSDRTGAVLIASIIALVILGAMGTTLVSVFTYQGKSTVHSVQSQQAFSLAEAGREKSICYLVQASTFRTTGKTEYLEGKRYTIVVATGTGSNNVDITSTGQISGKNKTVYQTVNVSTAATVHPTFSYALFTGGGNVSLNNTTWITGNVLARGNVYVAVGAKITGGTVAATGTISGPGTYTVGPLPSPVPTMPTLDATYYNTWISSANGQPSGNRTYSTTVYLNSSTVLVNGNVTIRSSARIIGPGRIVTSNTRSITIQNTARVEQGVELISGRDITVTNSARVLDNGLLFARRYVYIRLTAQVTGDIVAQNNIYLYNSAIVRGIVYGSQYLYTYTNANITGSAVVRRSTLSNSSRITYSDTYADTTPTGIAKTIITNVTPVANSWYGG